MRTRFTHNTLRHPATPANGSIQIGLANFRNLFEHFVKLVEFMHVLFRVHGDKDLEGVSSN